MYVQGSKTPDQDTCNFNILTQTQLSDGVSPDPDPDPTEEATSHPFSCCSLLIPIFISMRALLRAMFHGFQPMNQSVTDRMPPNYLRSAEPRMAAAGKGQVTRTLVCPCSLVAAT